MVLHLVVQSTEDEIPEGMGGDVARAQHLTFQVCHACPGRPGGHAFVIGGNRQGEVQAGQALARHVDNKPPPAEDRQWQQPRSCAQRQQADFDQLASAAQVASRKLPALQPERDWQKERVQRSKNRLVARQPAGSGWASRGDFL